MTVYCDCGYSFDDVKIPSDICPSCGRSMSKATLIAAPGPPDKSAEYVKQKLRKDEYGGKLTG